MFKDGLEDLENMYTTQLNDYFYNSRKNTCTQSHIHNVNYTIRNGTYNGTTEDDTHNGTKEDGTQNGTKNNKQDNIPEDDTIRNGTHKNDSKLKTAHKHSLEHTCIHTVELPTSEHWRPEVKVAKKAEIKNLQDYETFIEVKDEGQTRVGSRWVITEKEQHDCQKTKVKARLVA